MDLQKQVSNRHTLDKTFCVKYNSHLPILHSLVLIVTPAEVCKIRMQSQFNSLIDPSQLARRKYTNVIQTAYTITKEEGFGALYK